MKFFKDSTYHIYNQGNNRRLVFHHPDNYEFFIWKMRGYLLPFGEFTAWCLMPNHFHFQFFVNRLEVKKKDFFEHRDAIEMTRRINTYGNKAIEIKPRLISEEQGNELIDLNTAIGLMQQSYTKSLNKCYGWTGSIFRGSCKAKDGFNNDFLYLENINSSDHYFFDNTKDYRWRCFHYIHNNPIVAGLTKRAEDYPWSSASEYTFGTGYNLCNLELGREIVGIETPLNSP